MKDGCDADNRNKPVHGCRMVIDDGNYSIGQVYGVFDSFFERNYR